MRDSLVFRAAFQDNEFTFAFLRDAYARGEQDSLDAVGVPHDQHTFLKILRLDVDGQPDAVEGRGRYTEEDFQKEVDHARFAALLGLGPQFVGYQPVVVQREGNEVYGCIAFERLHGSLEDLMKGRQRTLDARPYYQITSPQKAWGDASSDDDSLPPLARLQLSTPPPIAKKPPEFDTPAMNRTLEAFLKWLLVAVKIMYNHQFFHMDMHQGNIFYKDGESGGRRWYFIDFGRVVVKPTFPFAVQDQIHRARPRTFQDVGELLLYSVRVLRSSMCELSEEDKKVHWNDALAEITKVVQPPSAPRTPPKSAAPRTPDTPLTR